MEKDQHIIIQIQKVLLCKKDEEIQKLNGLIDELQKKNEALYRNLDFIDDRIKKSQQPVEDLLNELEGMKVLNDSYKKKTELFRKIINSKNQELAAYKAKVQEATTLEAKKTDQEPLNLSTSGKMDDGKEIMEKYKILDKKYQDLSQSSHAVQLELFACQEKLASMISRKDHQRHVDILKTQLENANKRAKVFIRRRQLDREFWYTQKMSPLYTGNELAARHMKDALRAREITKEVMTMCHKILDEEQQYIKCREEQLESDMVVHELRGLVDKLNERVYKEL